MLQVIRGAIAAGHRVTVAFGRAEVEARLPAGCSGLRIRGLASMVESAGRLMRLVDVLRDADVVHLQNIMNPIVLRAAVATGRAVVTVQDHRVFCPGPGKTLPCGGRCDQVMSDDLCRVCLPDDEYRQRMVTLTAARLEALAGTSLVVLSRYMQKELEKVGCPGAEVIPPWVEGGAGPPEPGRGFVMGGRLVGHKGVLDGWRAWRRSGCAAALRVAGEGPLGRRLAGADLLGWLSHTALREELHRSRGLVFPSRWQEPFGVLGVEALAERTPVIVADSGGTGEWSDVGCLRCAAGDVAAMAEGIARLASDAELARRLGREGRAMVAERFGRTAIEGHLDSLYHSIVD